VALVPLDPDRCPDCGLRTEVDVTGQPALFFHGGYGAVRTTTVRWCPCGWTLTTDITETRP
jgi:hypothetical protein